ncbi:LysR family transcriptional regulator [Curvibacter sp. CHRR-16]|uniref:LysR family transcriptional regulator n=1 Tax=Curvibacter sp. CHRR-16 TaxID=2835872 RepID=UPI001BD99F46|nr:LysR family transcriptional regulator [Curvibacter sp. CHRR-16]MBT0571488.1 LysR family transcriptional regulator [Curvibacter sp. CHRR-16]
MFEISQIQCFVAVAEELHFGRAAKQLHMTQSPLSRQIQLLEHAVGAQLLERGRGAVQLTPAGKAFLPEAQRILQWSHEAIAAARRVAHGDAGAITLGFTAGLGCSVVPQVLARIKSHMPGVQWQLRELPTAAQLDGLSRGVIDLAFVRPHPSIHAHAHRYLHDDSWVLAVPQQHAAQWPDAVPLEALHQRPVLMYAPQESAYFHRVVQSWLDAQGVQPQVVEYVSQVHTMLALVGVGLGVALIPAQLAKLQLPGVVLRTVQTAAPCAVQSLVCYRAGADNPVLQRVLTEVLPVFLQG